MSCPTIGLHDAVESVLDRARANGATEAEVAAAEGDSLDVSVRLGATEKLKRSRERRLAVRLFFGRSSAICSTADLTRAALDDLVTQCSALARATAPDPFSGLPSEGEPITASDDLELYDSRAEEFAADEALEIARRAERAALDADPRITNSEGSEFSCGSRLLVYGTSRGRSGQYRTSSFSLTVVPVASAAGEMQRDYWYCVGRASRDLDAPDVVGRIAAARALRRLGSRSVTTCEVPVVFDPDTSGALLGHLAAAVSGSSVYRGTSYLRDRLGERVASPQVTIVDDPLLPRRLGSRPFDAEGIPSRRNVVVRSGVLETFLLDAYSARKLGLRSTASAVRALGDAPSAGVSNFYLEPGTSSAEEVVASVEHGFYVTELIGFGVNPVTGDYSRGAAGLWIEKGRLSFPVHEVTIAGNLLEMFEGVEMIGSDLAFRSTIAAPTTRIARMTVAGRA